MDSPAPKKVLLVDDNTAALALYGDALAHEGFMVETAADAALALKALKGGFAPDLIITDILMPTIDGVKLLDMIKEGNLAPNAKLMVLSNEESEERKGEAAARGISSYLVKRETLPPRAAAEAKRVLGL